MIGLEIAWSARNRATRPLRSLTPATDRSGAPSHRGKARRSEPSHPVDPHQQGFAFLSFLFWLIPAAVLVWIASIIASELESALLALLATGVIILIGIALATVVHSPRQH